MNAWWIFRVECGLGQTLKYIYQSKQMQLSDAQAEAELVKTMAVFAGKTGCVACAIRFHEKKWVKFECRPVGFTSSKPKPVQQPQHAASQARASTFPYVTRPAQRTSMASPMRRPWPMRGIGGCVPCGMGAESDAYMEAEKVIAENPAGEPSWFVKHWPLLLVGGGVLAAGMIYVGARN